MHLFSRAMAESQSLNLQSVTDLVLWCPSSSTINVITGSGWKGTPQVMLWCLQRVLGAVPDLLSDLAETQWMPHLSGQPLLVCNHPHCQKGFPDVQNKTPLFHFVPSGSGSGTRQQRRPSSVSSVPSPLLFVHWWDVPEPSLLSWRTTVLPALPYRQEGAFPSTPSWPLAAHSPVHPCLSYAEEPTAAHSIQGMLPPLLNSLEKAAIRSRTTLYRKCVKLSQLFLTHASTQKVS